MNFNVDKTRHDTPYTYTTALSHDGRLLALLEEEHLGVLRVYEWATGTLVSEGMCSVKLADACGCRVCFTASNDLVVVDKEARVRQFALDGTLRHRVCHGKFDGVDTVASQGDIIALGNVKKVPSFGTLKVFPVAFASVLDGSLLWCSKADAGVPHPYGDSLRLSNQPVCSPPPGAGICKAIIVDFRVTLSHQNHFRVRVFRIAGRAVTLLHTLDTSSFVRISDANFTPDGNVLVYGPGFTGDDTVAPAVVMSLYSSTDGKLMKQWEEPEEVRAKSWRLSSLEERRLPYSKVVKFEAAQGKLYAIDYTSTTFGNCDRIRVFEMA